MKAYWFRFLPEKKYVGLVIARDWTDLFGQVDEFGDPYSCEFSSAKHGGSFCMKFELDGDERSIFEFDIEGSPTKCDMDVKYSEFEGFECIFRCNRKWKTIDFDGKMKKEKGEF